MLWPQLVRLVKKRPPLSTIINPTHFNDPEWRCLHDELEQYSVDKHVFACTNGGAIHRKGWEWTHCIYGLKKLGAIKDDARALGVGAGREPIIFYLGDHVAEVVATDLYGNDAWKQNEAPAEIIEDAARYCPRPLRSGHIRFQSADGTDLPFEDLSFDLCWSLSSIEHFGGHEAAARCIRQIARVLRPGGVACIASEYLLLPEYTHPEYFTRLDIERYILNADSRLRPVPPMSWRNPPLEYLIDQIMFAPKGVERTRRHVVLNDGQVQWTSFMVFMRKI